ncbi:MAG: hypothetical protein VYB72_04645, partial [Planctomycetota bacterium]|nr:hypothetical protein [Planctomycetota bacterium]
VDESVLVAEKPCVLLHNDNILFGVARQVGPLVFIKTSRDSEITLKQDQVLCWADSPQNLYRYRVDHRQENDISAMLRDARWCVRYGLYDLAAHEILAMRRLMPKNAEIDLVENELKRIWAQKNKLMLREMEVNQAGDVLLASSTSDLSNSSGHTSHSLSTEANSVNDLSSRENLEFAFEPNSKLLKDFTSHIQPMLVNRCGLCHGLGSGGFQSTEWNLRLPAVGSRATASMTRENLNALIKQIDYGQPSESPLYTMAVEAHGGAEAALTARNAAAIQHLSIWINSIAALRSNLESQANQVQYQSADRNGQSRANKQATHQEKDKPLDAFGMDSTPGDSFASIADDRPGAFFNQAQVYPSRLPVVHNPFDPQLFNRRYDLQKKVTSP